MAKTTASKKITAPREKVWATLADPRRFEDWMTLHTKWKEAPPAEVTVGSKVVEVLTIMGMANTITFTVDSYDAPSSLRMSGEGMAGAQITISLNAEDDGDDTLVTIEAEFVSQMMVGAIGGAIERASTKELEASLNKLADLFA